MEWLVPYIQYVGMLVPLIGLMILLRKDSGRAASDLMLASVGCIIVNAGYLLMLKMNSPDAGMVALKIEYLGNAIFYAFFILFLIDYFRLRYPHWPFWIWGVLQAIEIFVLWDDKNKDMIFKDTNVKEMEFTMPFTSGTPFEDISGEMAGELHVLRIKPGILYVIQYTIICFALSFLIGYTIFRIRRTHIRKERMALLRLVISEIIVMFAMVIYLLVADMSFDILPFCASGALLLIILSVVRGELFNVTDAGRTWMFEHMQDIFLITDSMYGYLDANAYAKQLFPELEEKSKNERIPRELYELFVTEATEYHRGERCYEKTITPLLQDNSVEGYCLLLMDVTRTHQLVEELKGAKAKAEDANQAKSAFMSSMSHEIRTPMNAIVGMTEILLRSEMSPQQQGYLNNIKNSGNALLTIINDILDFSKIESGKLEIVNDEYEPMSMLNDLSMIFLNRIGEKGVELLYEIDPALPNKLYGDSLRLRQVIINITNNAIKFTQEGYVKLSLKMEKIDEREVELSIRVKDTGQGIKEEDLGKLFQSFQQVDMKKNHSKEGTGLGLSISKQLVELMGGDIGVRSTYGKGSEFYFTVRQRIVEELPAAHLKTRDRKAVSGYFMSEEMSEALKKLAADYGMFYMEYNEVYRQAKEEGFFVVDFLFTDGVAYRELAPEIFSAKEAEQEICILQNPMTESMNVDGAMVVNKPLYSLNFCQILNREELGGFDQTDDYMNFTAPKAKILIVDDNEMNLKVAIGLLGPLQMQIETAESGKQAIEMTKENRYDLIFMDHMMPVMDGVEATKYLRAMEEEYFRTVPIIALTANAVIGARETFRQAGMNDFVAKPIEMKEICAKLKTWLPKEKVEKNTKKDNVILNEMKSEDKEPLPEIEGLDVAEGIKNSGTKELFLSLLGDFYKLIDMKATKIEKCLADGMVRDFTIEVHALKNTARMIGAMELSGMFLELEQLGNAEDLSAIAEKTPKTLALYRSYKPILRPYGQAQESEKREASKEELIGLLGKLRDAMEGFDLDGADGALKELEECRMPDELQPQMEKLRAYVADVAMMEVMELADEMAGILK
jgi:signal transduction histidine kinase/CheY-like chemotaxis protein